MANELGRLDRTGNFRVDAVALAYLFPTNPLYRPPPPQKRDQGFRYSRSSLKYLPGGNKYASVDEALDAVRKAFSVH